MNYKITIIVESEDETTIYEESTTAGMADFEENIVRKAGSAIKAYEVEMEDDKEAEVERQKENIEYGV